MTHVSRPADLNAAFADRFNARDLTGLLDLYEAGAAHFNGRSGGTDFGREAIRAALGELMTLPGQMTSRNTFCLVAGDLALLRADWVIRGAEDEILAQGSSAEVARRQANGGWRTVIDHAVGASLPPPPG